MFTKMFIGFYDYKNINFDIKIIKIETYFAILETKMYFSAAILNFKILAEKSGVISWFLSLLGSVKLYCKTLNYHAFIRICTHTTFLLHI